MKHEQNQQSFQKYRNVPVRNFTWKKCLPTSYSSLFEDKFFRKLFKYINMICINQMMCLNLHGKQSVQLPQFLTEQNSKDGQKLSQKYRNKILIDCLYTFFFYIYVLSEVNLLKILGDSKHSGTHFDFWLLSALSG